MENNSGDNGLLFHHWDADGISSAAILLRHLEGNYTTFTPKIGNYYINDEDQEKIRSLNPGNTLVVDMALPKDSIDFLKTLGEVHIFDHHLQEKHDVALHHNPIIAGESTKKYPSTTWVITEYLDLDPDLLTVLGAFGDRETKLKDNPHAMRVIEPLLRSFGVSFDDLLKTVYMIDTLHKRGDRKGITEFPWFLMEVQHPEEILHREDLTEYLKLLEKRIEEESKRKLDKLKDGVYHLEMDSPYNIISTVTRRIAWNRSEEDITVVTNSSFQPGETQIYIRGPIPDSKSIIEFARSQGYSAGGKSDVVGMVVPTDGKERMMDAILEKL
ncbi:MAG: hypothetical protein R6U17_00040 [Thermoplasmata archaeon]